MNRKEKKARRNQVLKELESQGRYKRIGIRLKFSIIHDIPRLVDMIKKAGGSIRATKVKEIFFSHEKNIEDVMKELESYGFCCGYTDTADKTNAICCKNFTISRGANYPLYRLENSRVEDFKARILYFLTKTGILTKKELYSLLRKDPFLIAKKIKIPLFLHIALTYFEQTISINYAPQYQSYTLIPYPPNGHIAEDIEEYRIRRFPTSEGTFHSLALNQDDPETFALSSFHEPDAYIVALIYSRRRGEHLFSLTEAIRRLDVSNCSIIRYRPDEYGYRETSKSFRINEHGEISKITVNEDLNGPTYSARINPRAKWKAAILCHNREQKEDTPQEIERYSKQKIQIANFHAKVRELEEKRAKSESKRGIVYSATSEGFSETQDILYILLNVPYAQKNQVKALGAKWNPDIRRWYISSKMDYRPFLRWIPQDVLTTGTTAQAETKEKASTVPTISACPARAERDEADSKPISRVPSPLGNKPNTTTTMMDSDSSKSDPLPISAHAPNHDNQGDHGNGITENTKTPKTPPISSDQPIKSRNIKGASPVIVMVEPTYPVAPVVPIAPVNLADRAKEKTEENKELVNVTAVSPEPEPIVDPVVKEFLEIESEIVKLLKANETSWRTMYNLIARAEKNGAYLKFYKNLSAWLKSLSNKTDITIGEIWKRRAAGLIYEKYVSSMQSQGRSALPLEKTDLSHIAIATVQRIAGPNETTRNELLSKVINHQLTQKDLNARWKEVSEQRKRHGLPSRVNSHSPLLDLSAVDNFSSACITSDTIIQALKTDKSWFATGACENLSAPKSKSKIYQVFKKFSVSEDIKRLDALVVENLAHAGLAVHGISIKTSEAEIKKINENQAAADFCDYFWVAVPSELEQKKVADIDPKWGILSVERNEAVSVIRKASALLNKRREEILVSIIGTLTQNLLL